MKRSTKELVKGIIGTCSTYAGSTGMLFSSLLAACSLTNPILRFAGTGMAIVGSIAGGAAIGYLTEGLADEVLEDYVTEEDTVVAEPVTAEAL